ncbi:MAG: histidine ammonia-lyase, partial [Longimicrobiales bacterium]
MITIDGRSLRLEDVERVARGGVRIALAPDAFARVEQARALVERVVAERRVVYGITTGFGALAEVVIPPERIRELQLNLIRSHAAGVGDPYSPAESRAITLLRANVLALGHSGVRPVVIERLLDLLNAGIEPIIPERGSVGASGDLAPLSHLALVLLGEGEAWLGGERMSGADALQGAGLEPLVLEAKEGLALNNGTQVQTGVGILALLAAERAVETAEVAGALSLEALRGTPDAFAVQIQQVRPHAGQATSAQRLRALLADSEVRESHRDNDPRVQDAYSLRCMPQVHGAARNGLGYARSVLEIEANSATDNPLIFADDDVILSGGNFHGQPVAQVLDVIAMVCADLAAISERRIARLVDPALSGLPAFLTRDAGVSSGLMMAQIVAASLVSEIRLRAHPA